MQGYRRIEITKDEIVPLARQKRSEGVFLIMIHGFLDWESGKLPDMKGRVQSCWKQLRMTTKKVCFPMT